MGHNEFDCACVFVVFTYFPLAFHSSFLKPVGHGSIGLLQAQFDFGGHTPGVVAIQSIVQVLVTSYSVS